MKKFSPFKIRARRLTTDAIWSIDLILFLPAFSTWFTYSYKSDS